MTILWQIIKKNLLTFPVPQEEFIDRYSHIRISIIFPPFIKVSQIKVII
jgi:hypothetical protein